MKASEIKKNLFPVSLFLIGFFIFVGCIKKPQMSIESIPPEIIPKNATVSIYLNAYGDFVMADRDGTVIKSDPILFSTLLKKADRKKPGWIKLLGSYTLFQINEDSQVWLCDNDLKCIETQTKFKSSRPVFGINYDIASGKVFVSDAQGNKVEIAEKPYAVSTDKSQSLEAMRTTMGQEKLIAFTDLIEKTDLSSVKMIRTLRTLILFKVRGSNLFVDYNPNTGTVSFGCIDSNSRTCAPISPGCCPPGLCP